jgi:maleylacetate reductase
MPGANADLVVAIGGGSVVDAAKIILMSIEHEIAGQDGPDGYETIPERRFGASRNPKVRMIAMPSALSDGECNSGTLVTDARHKQKQIFSHPMKMSRIIKSPRRASLFTSRPAPSSAVDARLMPRPVRDLAKFS